VGLSNCLENVVIAVVTARRDRFYTADLRYLLGCQLREPNYSGVAEERKQGNITTTMNIRAIIASCITGGLNFPGECLSPAPSISRGQSLEPIPLRD
jgi:hypothetical protein